MHVHDRKNGRNRDVESIDYTYNIIISLSDVNITSSLHHRYFFPGSVLVHMDSDETTKHIDHEVEFFNNI